MSAVLAEPQIPNGKATGFSPARAIALRAWRERKPSAGVAEDAVREAAAIATLVETDEGPRFEVAPFADLVDLIAELPF